MPVMQPPNGPIEVSDPNNVRETFVSCPFNIMFAGGYGALCGNFAHKVGEPKAQSMSRCIQRREPPCQRLL